MPDTLHTLATEALERCCEERDAARAEVERLWEALTGKHDSPEGCPTWYDWCNCGGEMADRVERLREDRRRLLMVDTTDGMTASEWMMRTASAENARDEARAEVERLTRAIERATHTLRIRAAACERAYREAWANGSREAASMMLGRSTVYEQAAKVLEAETATHRAVLRQDFAADAERLELEARIKEQLNGETR